MAENFALRTEVRELKLGASFTNPKSTAFHTVRYDFKPASVDVNKSALVNVSNNNQVTVNVPHLDGAGTSQTVFKGSQKPYYKECVLIIDRVTGEITLEKLTSNIQVKKTRSESNNKPGLDRAINNTARSLTPVEQRVNSKKKKISAPNRKDCAVTTNLAPKHSPLHASPNHRSPRHVKQPEKSPTTSASPMSYGNHQQSTSASLPVIGFDDYQPPPTVTHQEKSPQINGRSIPPPPVATDNTIGILSDSSSSSSGSDDSGSGSDSESEANATVVDKTSVVKRVSPAQSASSDSESDDNDNQKNGNLSTNNGTTLPNHLLTEDLCLSESGSDSD